MSLGTSYIDGLASGLDTTSIINQIASIQRRPIARLNLQKSQLTQQLTLYQAINASLSALQFSAESLSDPSDFVLHSLTTSNDDLLAASASASAQTGTYEIVVQNLASAHKISSGAISTSDEALGYSGDFLVNGEAIELQATDTLTDVRNAINNAGAGVTATILQVSEDEFRLNIEANQTGVENAIDLVDANSANILQDMGLLSSAASVKHAVTDGAQSDAMTTSALDVATALGLVMPPSGTVMVNGQAVMIDLSMDSLADIRDNINTNVTDATASIVSEEVDGETVYRLQIIGDTGTPTFVDDNNVLQTIGVLSNGVANQKQAAVDATAIVDGYTVTRATNSMDDVIAGVSIELLDADAGETVTLTVASDLNSVVGQVTSFANSFNQVVNMINNAQSYDTETNTGGLLFGNAAVLRLEDGLHRSIMSPITVAGGSNALLSSIGISTSASGTLVVDTTELRAALESDPNAVARLFGLNATASTPDIEFFAGTELTQDSGPDGYAVNITQAATRAAATSANLAGGITTYETLTFDGQHDISLTAGMSLTQAEDHLNSWFATYGLSYEASVTGGQLHIEHEVYGANHQISISSSLDQGAGGTDLGGATAGEAATYAGLDVAGTINGEECTGSGQFLRAVEGNERTTGLSLRITGAGTGDIGTITIAKGAAARLSDYAGMVTDADDGSIARSADSIEDSIDSIDDNIDLVEERAERYVDRLRAQFLRLETTLAQAASIEQYMTGQLSSLQTSYLSSIRSR